MTIHPGTRFNHYQIHSPIGAGGMGKVYLAEDTRLDRQVALKVLPEEFAKDAERMRRFVQEAKSASALNHPNILTIHEIGESDGQHYIATEFIEGETLRHHIQHSRMKLREVLDILVQVASALSTAHQAGIIHRDIKPENVMLRPDGLIKVLDFGLAKLTDKTTPTMDSEAATAKNETDPGTIMGTVRYMSPEQARGKTVDARTDIFSLGVVLYEMVAGRAPFLGESSIDMLLAIFDKEPPPLVCFADDIPTELQRIVSKCLRKEPDERYQTMKDVLLDLKELRDELALEAKLGRSLRPASDNENQKMLIASGKMMGGAAQTAGAASARTTSGAEYLAAHIRRHLRGATLATLIGLLTALGLGYWFFFLRSATPKPIESIAVLPFVNESRNADVEYLSDGMTETLIGSLSQLPNLNVKARSSVFRYKGKEFDLPKIAQELKVQAILIGRVVQRGEQLTLSLELVDTRTENVIWSEQYNRKQADLITLQSEIARDVSSKLKTKLSGVEEAKVTKNYTANPEAYQLYLKGRYYWNKRTEESVRKGFDFFQQAIDKDPSFALAYVGLADSYFLLGTGDAMTGVLAPQEAFPKASAATEKALEIDNSLAEAWASRARIAWYEFDWVGTEKDLRHSIELNPNYPTAHHWYALLLSNRGRVDEALKEIHQAQELDPLALPINANEGYILYFARRYDEAIEKGKKTLDLDATFALNYHRLGVAYEQKEMYKEAIGHFQQAVRYSNRHPAAVAALGHAFAVSGNRGEAQRLLAELKGLSESRYVSPYNIALIYLGLREKEQARQWLEKAYDEKSFEMNWIKVEPRLDPLRSDPRFTELLRRMNLPQ